MFYYINKAPEQIAEKAGAKFSTKSFQVNRLETAPEKQYFAVFKGVSKTHSTYVVVGIVNKGKKTIFDPQTGETIKDISKFGEFITYPMVIKQ